MALEKYRETIAMKAFILDRYGSADGVRVGDMPDPELREDDVLVQVHAAGVNLLDSKIRNGEFKRILPYRLPLILGHDVAGVVARVGSRVRRFRPGDEVYARPADGRIGRDRRGEVEIRFVSELCHIPLETPGTHRDLRRHADVHRCFVKSLIGSALVGFGMRQHARRRSISKRAPSTTRPSLPLKSSTYGLQIEPKTICARIVP
jgi:hypothetical protein